LHRRLLRLAQTQASEEAARREAVQPPVATATDTPGKATFFWISATKPDALEPMEMELPLSAEPAQRAKQILQALITKAPTPEQRTLPADASLLEFYIMPDGIAVADFSENLATATPSGILSEQMAVESIVRTVATNLPDLHWLKILIHGQETETLAGHIDLTGYLALETSTPRP
jgi:spore germination protein GerM